jgi:hypothetical protein
LIKFTPDGSVSLKVAAQMAVVPVFLMTTLTWLPPFQELTVFSETVAVVAASPGSGANSRSNDGRRMRRSIFTNYVKIPK